MRWLIRNIGVFAVLVSLCACAGRDTGVISSPSETASGGVELVSPDESTLIPDFDPPTVFASSASVTVEALAYVVHEYVIYGVGGSEYDLTSPITATSVITGEELWAAEYPSDLTGTTSAPMVADVAGRPAVFLAYFALLEGSGTSVDREVLRVEAYDAGDGSPVSSFEFDLAELDRDGFHVNTLDPPQLVGADADSVIVRSGDHYDSSFTVVFDHSGGVRHVEIEFAAASYVGGVIVGTRYEEPELFESLHHVEAITPEGSQQWSFDGDYEAYGLGEGMVQAYGNDPTVILDAASGAEVATLTGSDYCRLADAATVVCNSSSFYRQYVHVIGVDLGSGEILWEISEEDEDRLVPDITEVYKGLVYAWTENGMVILDAATGQDLATAEGSGPGTVIPGYGLWHDRGTLYVYPAIG